MPVIYKCKECGGQIEPQENGLGKCLYCGALQTLPKEKDDAIQNLLNRANDFRLNCDFDRAIFEYEEVLKLSETEPEAHWGLFLSKYGVEYVKDNMTFTYKPTLHRISSISVFDDVDYKATIKYADPFAASKYKADAEIIETVMKELLVLSTNQEPYDVFLSYKEADDLTRQRTNDSFLAHDLYNELTEKGYKVFFAPKSLVSGLYEPKIYSAIISSKVMIVLGTKPEYFNAVWVKNEWSRFAELIEHGENKMIVPIFKDMDANQLPNRLSKYQAINMSNFTFLEQLMTIIDSYMNRKSRISYNKDSSSEEIFIERGFIALEDRDFTQAKSFFENALNLNPHNAQAYYGKLMIDLGINKPVQILSAPKYLNEYPNFQKALRYADHQLQTTLIQYEKKVTETINTQKYNTLNNELEEIQKLNLSLYEGSDISKLESNIKELESKIEKINALIKKYKNIKDFNDASKKIEYCEELINKTKAQIAAKKEKIVLIEQKAKQEEEARLWKASIKRSAWPIWLLFIAVGCISGPIMANYLVIPYILPLAYEYIDFEIPYAVLYIGMAIIGAVSGAILSHLSQEKYQISENAIPWLFLSLLVPLLTILATALVIIAIAIVAGIIYVIIVIAIIVIGGIIAVSCCGG